MTEEKLEFIMFIGPPASGKSTYAKKYEEVGYVVYSSDKVRAEFSEKIERGELVIPSNTNLNSMVFDHLQKEAISSLKEGKSVVIDATNLSRKRRMNFKKPMRKLGCVMKCVLFVTSIEECLRRNALRKGVAKVPDEAMYDMFCNYECPNYWEGWEEIILVADDVPYTFDYEKVIGFSQDNPHHTLTLDEHMQKAYEVAVREGFSDVVKKIAKCHDIGKVFTKRFENARGEKTETAHFYGHENYGAYLYLTEACCGKKLKKEEIDVVLYETNLINCHMRPLNVWRVSEKAKKRDKEMFGEQFFTDLVALNVCDKTAH